MSKKINELREKRAEVVKLMQDLLDLSKKEERDFTAEDETRWSEMETQLDQIDADVRKEELRIERELRVSRATADLHRPAYIVPGDEPGAKDFRNFGEFLHAVRFNPSDPRLVECRVQQMKDGTSGGYGIPTQFRPQLLEVPVAPSVVRPRATVIPAGSPPDAEITMPALDQRAASNMYGGVTIYHQGESDTATESTAALRKVTLKPKKLTGYMTASNELLANWDAASVTIPRLMRSAMDGAEDTDFFTGDGVNKAMGTIHAPAAIDYARATANQIAWADVYGMLARIRSVGGQPVWVASQTTIPQLVTIADASSRAIWVPSAVAGLPPTLYGYPVLFHDRSPALGSKGDLALVDFSAYVIKDGSGPFVAMSEHARFQNDEVAFRITWHVDGQPWLNEPIALEGSTANTVSPIVVLDTP